jgi:hypothetical protein
MSVIYLPSVVLRLYQGLAIAPSQYRGFSHCRSLYFSSYSSTQVKYFYRGVEYTQNCGMPGSNSQSDEGTRAILHNGIVTFIAPDDTDNVCRVYQWRVGVNNSVFSRAAIDYNVQSHTLDTGTSHGRSWGLLKTPTGISVVLLYATASSTMQAQGVLYFSPQGSFQRFDSLASMGFALSVPVSMYDPYASWGPGGFLTTWQNETGSGVNATVTLQIGNNFASTQKLGVVEGAIGTDQVEPYKYWDAALGTSLVNNLGAMSVKGRDSTTTAEQSLLSVADPEGYEAFGFSGEWMMHTDGTNNLPIAKYRNGQRIDLAWRRTGVDQYGTPYAFDANNSTLGSATAINYDGNTLGMIASTTNGTDSTYLILPAQGFQSKIVVGNHTFSPFRRG